MSFALSAGVTGLQAHQKMLDVAGNNLANVSSTAFKATRITFSELLSETIKKASQPTSTIGGTNPQQMGSGVGISGISPNMAQGNLVNTGNPLDLAVEGEGYFVVNDGSQDVYTRAGAFAVDADSNLVDPASGYLVQRIGSVGVSEGFQTAGDSNIHVPYDVAMAANATSEIKVVGNLSADATFPTTQTNVLKSNVAYTTNSGTTATTTTRIADLDQFTGTSGLSAGVITFSGYEPDGTALSSASPSVDLTMPITSTTTLGDVLTWLNTNEGTAGIDEVQTISGTATSGTFTLSHGTETTGTMGYNATAVQIETALEALTGIDDVTVAGGPLGTAGVTVTFDGAAVDETDHALLTVNNVDLLGGTVSASETTKGRAVQGVLGSGATATLAHGKITITDTVAGFSKSDLAMSYSGDGTLTTPAYFEIATVGGEEVKSINITVYDTQGGKHVLSGAFVRTDTANTWDMVMTSITGDIYAVDMGARRIEDIGFAASDGSFSGLTGTDTAEFTVTFAHDTANPQTMTVDTGTTGQLDGLTQFAGNSTAVAREQDGYEAGSLASVSADSGGTLIGVFSNGIKKNIATLMIALFQNPAALESQGGGYFNFSANSGGAIATQALSGGAGAIHGGALEKSNADVATEFVNMIQAQNGFQANARTIKVANEILRELTSLVR
ncbi:MAG: flagellar hook-basal body complex protein [Planctomycetota bacterium]|jgi:flagellar hook protein FlgE